MSDTQPQLTPRRAFLARVATTAAVVIASSAVATPLAAATVRRDETMPRDHAPPDFDDSWTQRVRAAKHRAVLDSPAVGDGLALEQAGIFMDGYHEMFGTSDAETIPVVVLRHEGVVMATNDAMWERYEFGKRTKTKDPVTGEETKRNPFVRIGADDRHALISAGASLSALAARGVILLACNRALMHLASEEAKTRNQDVEQTRAEFRAGLLPGVILQPSGIYAVTRAQEAGCTFLKST
jgi:intracellular sulfur oxidation DsrE/DsrF family protein